MSEAARSGGEEGGAWVRVPPGSDFTLANLPFGAFEHGGGSRLCVAMGDEAVDLRELAEAGVLEATCRRPEEILAEPTLNSLLAQSPADWHRLRARLTALLDGSDPRLRDDPSLRGRALRRRSELKLALPFEIGNMGDFYGCREHAINCGEILRPGSDPLAGSWSHMPVGTNRHRGTTRLGGSIVRPWGQMVPPDRDRPVYAPTRKLDFEIELGYVIGGANELGEPVPIAAASDHLFGVVLVNDWSSRDVQRWEASRHLTAKNTLTSISPWVVPLEALAPYRVPGPSQDPAVLDYLRGEEDWNFDLTLELSLQTAAMRAGGLGPEVISSVNARGLYWNPAQILASFTSTGATIEPGDLYCSGTVSSLRPGERGCMLELSRDGAEPLRLSSGESRGYLEDGDRIVLAGWAGEEEAKVGFGEVEGTVLSARELPAVLERTEKLEDTYA